MAGAGVDDDVEDVSLEELEPDPDPEPEPEPDSFDEDVGEPFDSFPASVPDFLA